MKRAGSAPIVASSLLALVSAEAAARLLAPREELPEPQPVEISAHFSEPEIARGRRYARPQMAIRLTRSAVDLAALTSLVRRPPRRPDPKSARSALIGSAAHAAFLSTALSLPGLPLAALARRRSLAVGLSTQSWRAWAEDLAKASAIQGVIAAAGGTAVTGLTRRWPRHWWLPAAGGSVLFGGVFATLAPVLLDPVFNDFTPLPEGETRGDVLALAAAAGVTVGEVYSVDASRRTTAANAYVTGLGPTKRVVLFDTLLSRFTRDEVKVVVAHELGHVHHRDVLRSLAFTALTAPAAALAIQRLSWSLTPERGTPTALPALALATGIVGFPLGLIANRLSRAIERRADAFSLELSDAPEAFVSFERTIAVQNVADLNPPRALTFMSTHPPTRQRVGVALAYQKRRAARPAR